MKDQNFEIISVAEDTGGLEAAGKFFDRANVTFTALVDPQHVVSTRYRMVNVPMGVWINESGRIVRPPEVAYSKTVGLMKIKVEGDRYVAGVRDWVKHGDQSPFALSPEEVRKRLAPPDPKLALADANFKLAVHLHKAGEHEAAETYWREAQRLAPDNWNYHRQAWAFKPGEATTLWLKKVRELDGRDYYAPLNLPEVKPEVKP